MPIYCFICDECESTKEFQRTIAKRNDLVKCGCGQDMRRDLQAEHGGHRASPGTYPMESDALGVHPDQIAEQQKFDAAHGVAADFTKEGAVVFRDKKHRREYCRVQGVHDRNAGYSDPVQE